MFFKEQSLQFSFQQSFCGRKAEFENAFDHASPNPQGAEKTGAKEAKTATRSP
jgi:hypothetical protein